ncbi:MAG: amidohydrolase family protein [Armatimonadota bacterium]|nr:MAG: amidohydrolase family protein [Armatimonadota bacterium]
MIDFHVHIGNMYRERYPQYSPLSAHQLIDRMDREGIEISVLLPLESPEGSWGYFLTEEAVAARDMYPERLIAFCCVDPRYPLAAQFIDYFVTQHGCKGFGEHVNGLAFDDERNKVIYAKCNEHGLALDFEINPGLCWDEVGLPRLESCLKEFADVKFVGHGPGFWAAISGDDDGAGGYPKRPITPGGVVDRLLAEYDNLYADLSAGSGYNAMTRDPEFAMGFIGRHWRKLLFGTDYLGQDQPMPQVEWLRALDVSEEVRQAIASENARRLLGLPEKRKSYWD